MALEVVSLSDLLNMYDENEVQKLLNTFYSRRVTMNDEAHDVENFLKTNAILFNKTGISGTHLILSSYKNKTVLVAYFTVANKELSISKKNVSKMSKTMQKKIRQRAILNEENSLYRINAFLIGQIGKNYSSDALNCTNINGIDILNKANDLLLELQKGAGGSFAWIEYEDVEALRRIYSVFGFSEIPNYNSPNNLKLAIKQLK